MLRWQTAGESHGEALVAMIEGLPSGVEVVSDDVVSALARRRLGYGRGARMKFEQDKVRLLTGVRHGRTLGTPIAVEIANTEWPKWTEVMSADPLRTVRTPFVHNLKAASDGLCNLVAVQSLFNHTL